MAILSTKFGSNDEIGGTKTTNSDNKTMDQLSEWVRLTAKRECLSEEAVWQQVLAELEKPVSVD